MKFQRNRGVKFSNPLGWLRSALSGNYQYSRWDSDVSKAKEKAKRESERSKLEQMEKERRIHEAEKLKGEAEKMKSQLAPEDREDLRKAAIEQISNMGVSSNWINEPLIVSVENEILRERMAGRRITTRLSEERKQYGGDRLPQEKSEKTRIQTPFF